MMAPLLAGRAVKNACLFLFFLIFTTLAFAQYQEAPQLAQQVEAGTLPPVEERLPENPLVVEPLESIGSYGGEWRTALLGGEDHVWLERTIDYENLVRWDPEWTTIIPNVAESFEASDDATEYTFTLRRGIRWSDGEPFTVDDIMFWYEDVLMNPELTPAPPAWLTSGGEPVVVERVDDDTVVFRFSEPNGLFMQILAGNQGWMPTSYPRHYLEQFHIDYNPDGIDALVQQAGAADWVSLFQTEVGAGIVRWQNSDLPTLFGWQMTTAYGESMRVVAERNPYYWKVDPEGNQLPYLDRVVYDQLEDPEVLLLRALAGDIDMMDRHVFNETNRSLFFDNQERGDYRFFENFPSQMNTMIISLNLNHKDPVMREVFQKKDFRIGLSHAIDRQEIIDLIYVGQGEPWQGAPQRSTPFFNERLAKQYTEYDVELANEHLDRAGYTERDAQGYRLGPDGNRISFVVEVTPGFRPQHVDTLELIQGYWQEVGIDMQVRSMDRSLLYTRKNANEHDAVVWLGGGGLDAMLDARYFFPFSDESNYAQAWQTWYNNPSGAGALTQPEEPPAATRRQMELYDQIRTTGDYERQVELMREIMEIAADEFYVIGISTLANGYGIVKNDLRNVPDSMPFTGGQYPNPAPTNPVQYYWDR